MIDMFTILLVHGLIAVALYRLMTDDTLDSEQAARDSAGAPADQPADADAPEA